MKRKTAQLLVENEKDRFEAEVSRRTRELALAEAGAALEATTALLHEVDHRVKNNLQMISSLIIIQSRNISDLGSAARCAPCPIASRP